MQYGQEVTYSEPVEVKVTSGSITSLGFQSNYENIEKGFTIGIRAYSASELPKAPSGLDVVAQDLFISSFLTLADETDDKWTTLPLKDLNPYLQPNVITTLPRLKLRLSSRSKIEIRNSALLAANANKVFYLQFLYLKAK